MQKILFYRVTEVPYGCFSNFDMKHPIVLKNKQWASTEHYFQAMKFVDTPFEEAIRLTDVPRLAARMGRDRSIPLRSDWEEVKDNVMRDAVRAKFTQHQDMKNLLLSTEDSELVEHTTNDIYWADGGDGSGKNMLGKILMEIREELKTNK